MEKENNKLLQAHGIINKVVSDLRSLVVRYMFCNGGQECSPQSLTGYTAGTLATIRYDTQYPLKDDKSN
jgi:hypothetical protein